MLKKLFKKNIIPLTILVLALTGCSTSSKTSIIVGGEYDAKKDVTNYFVFPYGSVDLPGKWEKTTYYQTARQQFFTNQDSAVIAVAFSPHNGFEFNGNGALQGFDLVKAFTQWEGDYYKSNGMEFKVIESDPEQCYQIFHIWKENVADTYFLFGVKQQVRCCNFSVQGPTNWTKEKKIQFLKDLINQ